MPNGFTTEQTLEMLVSRFDSLETKIDNVHSMVFGIHQAGCAQREGDIRRVASLESWKNRGIVGVIVALFTSLGGVIAVLWTYAKEP